MYVDEKNLTYTDINNSDTDFLLQVSGKNRSLLRAFRETLSEHISAEQSSKFSAMHRTLSVTP